ncbi:hypothetical protein NPX13_g6111 [Xylaria arbuscula]|uniref:Xylanolytic transcriptional activator regulatory domain-containing protein n=1 Tax=Xylaria arbuscula TaxID=114810 RepID=A0A9W8ND62_9PEZI|nr:hypothetical protein NPX13_g6111 [Xylaria arbuscula]
MTPRKGPKTAGSPRSFTFIPNQIHPRKRPRPAKRQRSASHKVSKIQNACIACRDTTPGTTGSPLVSPLSEESGRGRHQSTSSHDCGLDVVTIAQLGVPDDSLQEDQNGHIHGGASEFSFMHLARQRLASLPAVSIDFSDHPLPNPTSLAPILPPKHVTDQLIARYFDFGLSTSRLVHQPSLINIVDCIYNDEDCNPDDRALAYIVLALGSHYSNYTTSFCGFSASVRFYNMAQAQLNEVPDLVTITTSQARLLVIHYLLNHARMHEAWSIFGIVVRHIQALGLHRRSRFKDANCIRHEYRKRLFWCVYIYDRILSSMFGRPLALHNDDIDQEECALANDQDIEESRCQVTTEGVFCTSAALVHYARVARILGQILRAYYTPLARSQDITQLHKSALLFENSLKAWRSNLPPYLNYVVLPPSAVSMTAQRQMCTLKLMFAHASLLLYRPFILHAIDKTAEQTSSRQWVKRCHVKAIEAANTVVSECSYLTQQGLFSRKFWLVTYMQFASIGTLLMYSYIWPEDIMVRRTAEEAMDSFPIGIEGDPVGERYLATLRELRDMTRAAQNDPATRNNEIHRLKTNAIGMISIAPSGNEIHVLEYLQTKRQLHNLLTTMTDVLIENSGTVTGPTPASIPLNTEGLTLHGTGSAITGVKYLTPCAADAPSYELKRKYQEDGVLWVKGLLDPARVNKMRGEYLSFVNQGSNMLKPGTDPVDGIFSGADWRDFLLPGAVRVALGLKDDGRFVENAIHSHHAKFYIDFKTDVARVLEPFVGKLCDFEEPWCLPRSLLRCAVPGGESTPVHYDQIFLRAGPPTTITAWVPIGDVDVKEGGLIYLDRAHDIGKRYEDDFSRVNADLPDEERLSAFNRHMEKGGWLDRNAGNFGKNWSRSWLVGKYEAGDVLFHTPYTVHAGAINESETGRIRVSTDLRFVDKNKPFDERWTVHAYSENDPNTARKIPVPKRR